MTTSIPSQSAVASEVVATIRSVVGPGQFALHEPRFAGNEWQYLKECLDSTFVSSVGKFVDRFEHDLAEYTGAKHAVAVVNGTAALQVALQLAGVERDDEVIVPALTFIATANAVAHRGAIPHLADSEECSLGIDVDALREHLTHATEQRGGRCVNRQTRRVIAAVVPMHTFGHLMDIEGLLRLSRDFGIPIVEDAAEALGSSVGGQHAGTFGLLGTLSFNGNKTITTGGGGAILSNDRELARRAKHLTTTAKLPHRWAFVHDDIGYNYRLPNLNAALGCAQLEQLPTFLESKRRLYERYAAAFATTQAVRVVREPEGCVSNYWLQTLVLDESLADARDDILTLANDSGLGTRPVWTLMHELDPYRDVPRMNLSVAESLSRRVINPPSSAQLA